MSKEARELAQRFGVRMCDEDGMTHGEELYCLGLDDIIAMKESLAKQEQGEPVAWYIREKDMLTRDANWVAEYPDMCEPLYTTPQQQRKPLTEEQRRAIILKADTVGQAIAMVEAAHGIKVEA